jgi:excisionase family DNA binding protein
VTGFARELETALIAALRSPEGQSAILEVVGKALTASAQAARADELLTTEEKAAQLGITVKALYKRVSRGTIKPIKVGASLRFRRG